LLSLRLVPKLSVLALVLTLHLALGVSATSQQVLDIERLRSLPPATAYQELRASTPWSRVRRRLGATPGSAIISLWSATGPSAHPEPWAILLYYQDQLIAASLETDLPSTPSPSALRELFSLPFLPPDASPVRGGLAWQERFFYVFQALLLSYTNSHGVAHTSARVILTDQETLHRATRAEYVPPS
jgi:hypothetical protein